ncbi:hypothetical protein J3A83DRAFT_4366795 [Scleroderma citrinum]
MTMTTGMRKLACLLSMNAPLAHPINTPGAGSSLWPLQDCLLSSGGGSGESHSHSHSSPQETLLNPNLMQVNIIEPHPELHPRPIPNPLEGCLQEAPIFMFPPFDPKE